MINVTGAGLSPSDDGGRRPTITITLGETSPGQGDSVPHSEILPPAYYNALASWLELTTDTPAQLRTPRRVRPAFEDMPEDGAARKVVDH